MTNAARTDVSEFATMTSAQARPAGSGDGASVVQRVLLRRKRRHSRRPGRAS